MNQTDLDLLSFTRERIYKQDFEAVFMNGCCYHFAFYLHQRFHYKIRGIKVGFDPSRFTHVWCLRRGNEAVDIRGIHQEDLLVILSDPSGLASPIDVDPPRLKELIEAKHLPQDFEQEIFDLAEFIIDDHERFAGIGVSSELI